MSVATQVIVGGTPKRYGSLSEACAFSGLSIRTLRGLIYAGELTAHRPAGGGKILISFVELDRVIRQSSKRGSTRGRHLPAINAARKAESEEGTSDATP